jgi:hypothetical protein
MRQKIALIKAVVIGTTVCGLVACGLDIPKETKTSFETMTVKKQDITVPVKFSAKLKGQADVTITPQVNEAIADCQAARDKFAYYRRQVEVLYDAYAGTHELMDNGKASYIEVLTAQENLLSSQLNEATNMYKGAQAVIALYIALGGGTK